MTDQELKQLCEKLAKWAGFEKAIPVFTDSLDACFQWLVPRLRVRGRHRMLDEIHLYPDGSGWLCELDMVLTKDDEYEADKCKVSHNRAETPALALCRAIEKLIDKEVE